MHRWSWGTLVNLEMDCQLCGVIYGYIKVVRYNKFRPFCLDFKNYPYQSFTSEPLDVGPWPQLESLLLIYFPLATWQPSMHQLSNSQPHIRIGHSQIKSPKTRLAAKWPWPIFIFKLLGIKTRRNKNWTRWPIFSRFFFLDHGSRSFYLYGFDSTTTRSRTTTNKFAGIVVFSLLP